MDLGELAQDRSHRNAALSRLGEGVLQFRGAGSGFTGKARVHQCLAARLRTGSPCRTTQSQHHRQRRECGGLLGAKQEPSGSETVGPEPSARVPTATGGMNLPVGSREISHLLGFRCKSGSALRSAYGALVSGRPHIWRRCHLDRTSGKPSNEPSAWLPTNRRGNTMRERGRGLWHERKLWG
jgi:hypothetical protein